MSYLFNDAIINTYIDNTSCNLSYGLKVSGKGFYDYKNLDNNYSCNGISLQLLNNYSNIDNSNYSKKISFTNTEILTRTVFDINNSNIGITGLNSNNSSILPLILNSNIYITETNIGINTTLPQNYLHLHNNFNSNIAIQLTDSITGINNSNGVIIMKDSNQNLIINNNFNKGNIVIGNKANPNVFIIDSNGFIGIGTTNPKDTFDLIGNININGNIDLNGVIKNKNNNNIFVSSQW